MSFTTEVSHSSQEPWKSRVKILFPPLHWGRVPGRELTGVRDGGEDKEIYKPQPDGLESERCRIKHLLAKDSRNFSKVSEKPTMLLLRDHLGSGAYGLSLTAENTLSAALRQARPEAGGVTG